MASPGSVNRQVKHEVLHHTQERTNTVIKCRIWTGLLPDGTQSLGFYPNVPDTNLPGCYVAAVSELLTRNIRGSLSSTSVPSDGREGQIEFATNKVKFVFIEDIPFGMSGNDIIARFDIEVPAPFTTAKYGKLVLRKAQLNPAYSTPDGQTLNDVIVAAGLQTLPLISKMALAASLFGSPTNPRKGFPKSSSETYPAEGQVWK